MNYICTVCSKSFHSYNPKPQFCSRECKSKSQMADVPSERISVLYRQGHSQTEVAHMLGTSQKVVFATLKRLGIKARPAVKRDQRREKNSAWKGDNATVVAFHRRLDSLFGKPKKCEVCGTTDPKRSYDWANLTGKYKDLADYKRMCRSCHWKYDKKVLNIRHMRK